MNRTMASLAMISMACVGVCHADNPVPAGHSTIHLVIVVPTLPAEMGDGNARMANVHHVFLPYDSIRPVAIHINDEFVGNALTGQPNVSPTFVLPEGSHKFKVGCQGFATVETKLHVLGTGSTQYLVMKLPPSRGKSAQTSEPTRVDSQRVISSRGVGRFRIGVSTLAEILGRNSSVSRKKYADEGLAFEFNRGRELMGVTVSSSEYALSNGLRVGSSDEEVVEKLGPPKASQLELQPKQIMLDALVYDDYTFLLDRSKQVSAIRVGL